MAKDVEMKEKVGQRLMIGINGKTIDRETEELIQEIKPGSIILFSRNISSPEQVKRLITHIQNLLPSPPLIAIDQEGGRVIRFTKGLTVFPGNMALGAAGSPDLAFQQGLLSASQLKDIGIDINLAPVVDVITSHHNPGITIRSFGDDPKRVSDLACAFIEGTQKAGLVAVAKHFPGKGAAEVDAHFDLPTVSIPEKTFEKIHLFPFTKAIENGVKGIMSTHIYCPTLDSKVQHPATFSRKIVNDYIRTRLNYNGVIFSDDLEMGAIAKHYNIEETCLKTTMAGHDMLLICSNYKWQKRGFHALVDAYTNSLLSPEELDASVKRIHNLKNFCSKGTTPNQYKTSLKPDILAEQIAQQSITVICNEKRLLPIDSQKVKDLLLLIPDLSALPSLEEGYEPTENHFLIKECHHFFPGKVGFRFFSLNPEHGEIEQTTKPGNKHTLFIVFISNAQVNQGQKLLIKKVRQCYDNIVFVLLDNPFDCEFMNTKDTCITSYGFRKIQLKLLLAVIFGKVEAAGKLPFKVI
ncbi:MAG: beta-N-acetylhexosaminidase [Deltaproteobacteria bacterium]|nr:beta-N-acetylhexosaminidase [Deltaproteobacteria bacterium]